MGLAAVVAVAAVLWAGPLRSLRLGGRVFRWSRLSIQPRLPWPSSPCLARSLSPGAECARQVTSNSINHGHTQTERKSIMTTPAFPTFTDILRAQKTIRPYLPPTPLHHYPALDKLLGAEVYVKHENYQPI